MTLSTIHPDFDDIKRQLQAKLANKESWRDLLTSSTGDAIIEFCASLGTFDQFSIESALQEAYFETAKFKSSIYAKARSQGVRLSRKLPAGILVNLDRDAQQTTASYNIQEYSQFVIDGTPFFNRTAITFPEGVYSQQVTLYQGKPKIVSLYGTGNTFQRFISEEKDFSVSDTDVKVSLNNLSIPVTQRGLWHYKNSDKAVQDRTTKDGRLILTFGNALYATLPKVGDVVTVSYVVTEGSAKNNSFIDTDVTYEADSNIKGVAISNTSGGANQPAPEVYKYISPHIYSGGDKAITHNQYNAYARNYPGVIDAQLVGQRVIAPGVKEYMNLVRASLLTSSEWSDTDFTNFVNKFYEFSMHPIEIYRQNPLPRNFIIKADIGVKQYGDATEVKQVVTAVLSELVKLKYGSIGGRLYVSDIYHAIQQSHQDIRFINLISPETNIISNLGILNLTGYPSIGASALPEGSYTYWITAVDADGKESLPYILNLSTTLNNSVHISWDAHPYAKHYKIYGRSLLQRGFLAQTTEPYYIDIGIDTASAGSPPTVDNTGVFYPNCTTIDISTYYIDTLTR